MNRGKVNINFVLGIKLGAPILDPLQSKWSENTLAGKITPFEFIIGLVPYVSRYVNEGVKKRTKKLTGLGRKHTLL